MLQGRATHGRIPARFLITNGLLALKEGGLQLITKYLDEAMHRAKYKILQDKTYCGWIEDLPGVWANAQDLEQCRDELRSVVEDWLLLGLKLGHQIPSLGDIDLNKQIELASPR